MPFQSKAQARFMFSQHPKMAKEWADKTTSIKALPEHVGTPDHSDHSKHANKHLKGAGYRGK